MEERKTKKGGSKFLVGLIAFILGFLFAIIAEIGAIAGICFFVMNTDFDNIFNTFGITNDDGNGNKFINTDSENGGAKNVMELIGKLSEMYEGIGAVTVSEVKTLFPALVNVTNTLYDTLDPYVELDRSEFEATQFMDLPMYIQDAVMDVRPAKVMINAGMEDTLTSNKLAHAIIAGIECNYVYANPADKENSAKFPLYYDDYVFNAELAGGRGAYNRTVPVDGTDTYPANLDASLWLSESNKKSDDGLPLYRQYFYSIAEGDTVTYYVTAKDSSGEYVYQPKDDSSVVYRKEYGENYIAATGNYYYDNAGEEVQINPITVRSITEDAFAPLYGFLVTDFISGDKVIDEIFEGATVGELWDGMLDIGGRVGALTLPSVMDIDPESPIMVYIGYNLTGLINNGDGTYTGTHADGTTVTVYADGGKITRVTDKNGLEIKGVTVDDVPTVVDGAMEALTVADVMDVKATDAIMSYIGFGITDIKEQNGADYSYTARCKVPDGDTEKEVECFVVCGDGGVISKVYYNGAGGEKIYLDGTPLNGISAQVEKLTDNVKIKEVIDIDENDKLMSKLGDYTISKVGDAIDEIELGEFMDIKSTDRIMTYMAYGASGLVQAADGLPYRYTCTVTDIEGNEREGFIVIDSSFNITGVYYDAELAEPVAGTTINGVADRAGRLTNDLTLRDVIEIDENNAILSELADSKICDLSKAIDNLTLQKIFTDEIYSGTDDNGSAMAPAVMREAVKTVTDAEKQIEFSTNYVYYTFDGKNYVLVNSEEGSDKKLGKLTAAEYEAGLAAGTKYYTYGETKGLWKLMLCSTATTIVDGNEVTRFTSDEQVYKVNDFNKLIAGATLNIKNATLFELCDAGIVDEGSLYHKDTETGVVDRTRPKKIWQTEIILGELTILDALDRIVTD